MNQKLDEICQSDDNIHLETTLTNFFRKYNLAWFSQAYPSQTYPYLPDQVHRDCQTCQTDQPCVNPQSWSNKPILQAWPRPIGALYLLITTFARLLSLVDQRVFTRYYMVLYSVRLFADEIAQCILCLLVIRIFNLTPASEVLPSQRF
jgi:hypothetical protein